MTSLSDSQAAHRPWWRRALALLGALVAPVQAATLPEDRVELMAHSYSGGGISAKGPAVLLRKSLGDRVSVAAQYYVDAVSNASVDVVSTASPYKETRKALDLSVDWLVRDTVLTATAARSDEPDYRTRSLGLDVAHEVFGGMSTITLGANRSADDVGRRFDPLWRDTAKHWQYRLGLSQVMSPRWITGVHLEAQQDFGFLGSAYRVARVRGAGVPERVPRTRGSRALKLRSLYQVGDGPERWSWRTEYRYFWDNWDIAAHTLEFGGSKPLAGGWLIDANLRWYQQRGANFYSDNARTETLYVSRNRMLSRFSDVGVQARATYTLGGLAARFEAQVSGSLEVKRFDFKDFTDPRTGRPYAHTATLLQLIASARF